MASGPGVGSICRDYRRARYVRRRLALLIYDAIEVVVVVGDSPRESVSSKGAKILALGLIEATDVFLLGVLLFIISMGLYALFVDDTLPLPRWLEIHDLDDLKAELISVVVAVLAVLFLGEVWKWDGFRSMTRSVM